AAPGAFDRSPHGNNDAFVTKLNATGTALVYSTYLGGRSLEQNAGGIAVDAAGNAYATGGTASPDFPTTPGAFQTVSDGRADVFAPTLDPLGASLVYSTLFHGTVPPTLLRSTASGLAAAAAGAPSL